jgi:DNA-directed RNA polymerase specialized sigma subunit
MSSKIDKEALKALREKRSAIIERAREGIKKQRKIIQAIKDQIGQEAKSVPEIAAALGRESAEILLFVSALRKYGEVVEAAKDGDYFTYKLA